jgi:hypothetical protein
MPAIKACQKELQKAFARHCRLYDSLANELSSESPAKMVLFYAVECGLKACYLIRNRLPPTVPLPTSMYAHDLMSLLKDLRVPAAMTKGRMIEFRRRADPTKKYPHHEVHLAWRYSVDVHDDDDAALVADLKQLRAYAKEAMS